MILESILLKELSEESISTQEPTQVESTQTILGSEAEIDKAQKPETIEGSIEATALVFNLSSTPPYSGSPYIAVNGNVPYFTQLDLQMSCLNIFTV